ncbi:MAG: hypothetical protein ACLQG3_05875 [Terracidiphilus sp.]
MNRDSNTAARTDRRRNIWLWFPLGCAALCLAVLVPVVVMAAGGEGGFDGIVGSIETQYHVRATRIPFMGLASLIAGGATHGGVRGIHIAEFEHFSGPVDGEALNRMVEEKLGQGWERMIRETSRHGSEQTLIYAHPEGNRMGLFILDLDGKEMNVVQVSIDPDRLNETIGKYEHGGHGGDESGSEGTSD